MGFSVAYLLKVHGHAGRQVLTVGILSSCCAVATAQTGDAALGASAGPEKSRADTGLTEVVVNATRREERLQDVPASITAVSGDQLAAAHITTVDQIVALVPGLSVQLPYGAGSPPVFTLRGISANDFNVAQARPIPLYQDDALRENSVFEAFPFFDVERIDVLKGPQGALYGRNASGGAINIVTKSPGFNTEGELSVGYGGPGNSRAVNGAFQVPLIDQTLAVRVAFTYQRDNGVLRHFSSYQQPDGTWLKGSADGNDPAQTNFYAGRVALLFTPTDQIDATLKLIYADFDQRSMAPRSFITAPGLFAGYSGQDVGFFESTADQIPKYRAIMYGATLRVNFHPSDDITYTSITALDRGSWSTHDDDDGTPVSVYNDTSVARDVKGFYQELRAVSKFTGPLNFIAGLDYTSDSMVNGQGVGQQLDPRLQVIDPLGVGTTGYYGAIYANQFEQQRAGWAAFARGDYKLSDALTATLGGRYTQDFISVNNYGGYYDPTPSVQDAMTQQISYLPLFDTVSKGATSSNFSVEAGLKYKFSAAAMGYITFKQGYRGVAFNDSAFFDPRGVNLVKPEKVNTYEIGEKITLWNRLDLNAALFYSDYRNQQVLTLDPDVNTIQILSNLNATVRGAELDTRLAATHDLILQLAATYIQGAYNEGGVVNGLSVGGNPLVGSPNWSGTAGLDWAFAHIGDNSVRLHFDAKYTSPISYAPNVTAPSVAAGYFLFNGNISWVHKNFEVSFWGTNLFDRKYLNYVLDQTLSSGEIYEDRGNPRLWGVEVAYHF